MKTSPSNQSVQNLLTQVTKQVTKIINIKLCEQAAQEFTKFNIYSHYKSLSSEHQYGTQFSRSMYVVQKQQIYIKIYS